MGDFFKALVLILVLSAVAFGLLMLLLHLMERGDPGRPGREAAAMRRRAYEAEFGAPSPGLAIFDESAIPRLIELRRELKQLRRKEYLVYGAAYLIGAVAIAFIVTDAVGAGIAALLPTIGLGLWARSLHRRGNEVQSRFDVVRLHAGHRGDLGELLRWLDQRLTSQ